MSNEFIRTEMLIGKSNLNLLKESTIAIFGIGGVGSYVVEALARCSIGNFILVDNDIVEESNINRQLIATHKTIGKPKVEVAKKRILEINPNANVITYQKFYLPNDGQGIIDNCDYVVDAIDTITSKLALIKEAYEKNIKIISCMGTGNKINPSMFEICDIYITSVCPLCRVIRKELKKLNIPYLKVLYSKENPIKHSLNNKLELPIYSNSNIRAKSTLASISFTPSVAGLIIAAEIVKEIINYL